MQDLPHVLIAEIVTWITDFQDIQHLQFVSKYLRDVISKNLSIVRSNKLVMIASSTLRNYKHLTEVYVPIKITCQDDFIQLSHLMTGLFVISDNIYRLDLTFFARHYNKRGNFCFGYCYQDKFLPSLIIRTDAIIFIHDAGDFQEDLLRLFPRSHVISRRCTQLLPSFVEEFTYITHKHDDMLYWNHRSILHCCRLHTIWSQEDCNISYYHLSYLLPQRLPLLTHLEVLDLPLSLDDFIRIYPSVPNLKMIGLSPNSYYEYPPSLVEYRPVDHLKNYLEMNKTQLPSIIKIYCQDDEQEEVKKWQIGCLRLSLGFRQSLGTIIRFG